MTVYAPGTLRHKPAADPADSEVAIRTTLPEDDPRLAAMAWLVSSPRAGSRHTTTAEVETEPWTDLPTGAIE